MARKSKSIEDDVLKNEDEVIEEAKEEAAAAKAEKKAASKADTATEDPSAENEPQEKENAEDEVPEPAVVPADLGEEDRTPETVQNETVAPRGRRRHRRNGPARRELKDDGLKSDEILEKETKEKSEKELADETFKRLESLRRTGHIAWGEIYGVEPAEFLSKSGSRFAVCVRFNGAKILIPDKEYFEDTFNFGSDYDALSAEEKNNRRAATARYQIGARICFVVKGVSKDVIEEGEFAGSYNTVAVASRREAMAELRDMFFLHKHNPDIPSRTVEVGDTAEARVVGVREAYALVECLGVETRVDAFQLNDDYVENCNDFVKPGDRIKVRVRKVYVNSDDSIWLTVSGRMNEVPRAISEIKVGGTYLGKVDHYNSGSNTYTILLKPMGISASVKADASHINGGIDLMNGDDVSVLVTNVAGAFVIGKAKKL